MTLMTFEEAYEARVTPRDAIRELSRHYVTAHVHGDALVAWGPDMVCHTDGSITDDLHEFAIGRDGLVSGKAILDWLGY
jgi:hypothetical protein